ncbi:hypothetical protein ACQFYA_20515 [Promicromonospora sp. Marseille-Q5078]
MPHPVTTEHRADERHRLRPPLWATLAALGIVVLAVLAATVGSRVIAPQACPAIGYSSLLAVTMTGETLEVDLVQVRDSDRWQPPAPGSEDATAPSLMTSRDGDTWTFTLVYPPNPIALRALDDAGDVIARTEVDVHWVRVGGTAECGGPMEGHVDWAL